MPTEKVDAGDVVTVPSARVTQPRTSAQGSQGFVHSRPECAKSNVSGSHRASRTLSSALAWLAAALAAFAILAARTSPTLAYLALLGVITLWLVRGMLREVR